MTRLELGLTGDLGEMVFPDVLDVLMSGYDLLTRVQQEILGERADDVQWTLTGLRQGSAVTVLEARPTELVQADDLERVAHAYTQGTRSLTAGATVPPAYFDQAALESYRDMVLHLRRANVGDLVVRGPHDEPPAVVTGREAHELPEPVRRLDARYVTTGSVTGMVEAINLHGKREVTLWSDLDRARVVVTFPERLYSRVHDALRHRVEASGELTEDANGRPTRLRLEDIEVLSDTGSGLPTLESLVGSMKGMTHGLPPREWLERNRRAMGLG